jgi:hypothetical protein
VEHLHEWAVGEREIGLFDRKNAKGQQRIFNLPAITAQVASRPRNEDLNVGGRWFGTS